MEIKVNIQKKHVYLLSLLIILTGGILFVQGQSASNFGHSADDVQIAALGKSLEQAVVDGDFVGSSFAKTVNSNKVTGLTPGKKYLVNVHGITPTSGSTFFPVRVEDCNGNMVAETASYSVNWPDGNAPQSAAIVITAQTSGCVQGVIPSGGTVGTMTVVGI